MMMFFIFLYYLVFVSTLFLAKNNLPYWCLVISIIISLVQLLLLKKDLNNFNLIKYLILFSSVGYSVDCLLSFSQQITFYSNPWQPLAAPWILALWFNFSVLCLGIKSILINLKKYLFIIAALGFPLSYYSGASVGIATFNNGIYSIMVQGVLWAIIFPIIFKKLILKVE